MRVLTPRANAVLPIAGGFLGWLSWISGLSALFFFLSVLALSYLWGRAPGRMPAFLLFLGYYLVGASDIPQLADTFFEAGGGTGVALWLAHATLLALPFGLLHGHTHRPVRYALALAAVSFPPLGILGWLSPLLSAGVMFPGFGLAGLAATLLVLSLMAWAPSIRIQWARRSLAGGMLVAAAIPGMTHGAFHLPQHGWFGQNTAMGRYPLDIGARFDRHQEIMAMTIDSIDAGAKLILYPEEILGEWGPIPAAIWSGVGQQAKERGATVLVGGSTMEDGRRMNSLVAIGADELTVSSRMPMPVSMWKPWSSDGYAANVFSSGLATLQGRVAAVSICYEDLLVWPLAWSFAAGHPEAILSAGNNWFGNSSASRIQRVSVELQAQLYGVPLVRAINESSNT